MTRAYNRFRRPRRSTSDDCVLDVSRHSPSASGNLGQVTDGYDTPEEAALSGWTPEWRAYVIDTRYESEDRARVLVDTIPSHPMEVTCQRTAGKWDWVSDITA